MSEFIYLLRHAAPPEQARNRYWGKRDPGTDAANLATVAAHAGLIPDASAKVVSSPLERCVRTADVLAKTIGISVETDPELEEIDFGLFDGLTFAEVSQKFPEQADAWARQGDRYAFPDGESIHDFFHRTTAAWKKWRDADERSVVLVTHAGVIACWMCLFLGLPLARRFSFAPSYAALTAFRRKKDGSGWNLQFFNNRE